MWVFMQNKFVGGLKEWLNAQILGLRLPGMNGFYPWLANKDAASHRAWSKIIKNEEKEKRKTEPKTNRKSRLPSKGQYNFICILKYSQMAS